jgi:NAD(P)H-dependent FMN reductase
MSDRPHVAGLCGSLRETSYTRMALRHALAEADSYGATTALIDLRECDLPVFDADNRHAGDADRLCDRLQRADSVILGSPMYHGSYSAPLKNAIDYSGFDEFDSTTVGLLGVSGGRFPTGAVEHLRSVCRALNAWVIPHQAVVPNASSQFEGGEFVDERMAERVAVLGHRTVEYANIQPDPPSFMSAENVGGTE